MRVVYEGRESGQRTECATIVRLRARRSQQNAVFSYPPGGTERSDKELFVVCENALRFFSLVNQIFGNAALEFSRLTPSPFNEFGGGQLTQPPVCTA